MAESQLQQTAPQIVPSSDELARARWNHWAILGTRQTS